MELVRTFSQAQQSYAVAERPTQPTWISINANTHCRTFLAISNPNRGAHVHTSARWVRGGRRRRAGVALTAWSRSYGIGSVMYVNTMVPCADAVKCHGMTYKKRGKPSPCQSHPHRRAETATSAQNQAQAQEPERGGT